MFTKDYRRINVIPRNSIDILFSHPKCGNYSSLNSSKKKYDGDHPTFEKIVRGISSFKPKFFLIDNLPKSLLFYPQTWWSEKLPDYDVVVEFVSNYGYGNVQKNRDRVFIIGSLKDLKFVFMPSEEKNDLRVRHVLRDLPDLNNERLRDCDQAPGFQPHTAKSVKIVISKLKPGKNVFYKAHGSSIVYSNRKISPKSRIGLQILNMNKPAPTITGQLGYYRNDTRTCLTCRERARIQGVPDWFEFVVPSIGKMGAQTGKFIPVEFTRFFTQQVDAFLKCEDFKASGKRTIFSDTVTLNRIANCRKYGHSNMEKLCAICYCKCKYRK
jgi:site-specific DNA-cytosine methylase